jgi:hypothetical protein
MNQQAFRRVSLFAILFGINRLMGDFTVTKKPQTKAASA